MCCPIKTSRHVCLGKLITNFFVLNNNGHPNAKLCLSSFIIKMKYKRWKKIELKLTKRSANVFVQYRVNWPMLSSHTMTSYPKIVLNYKSHWMAYTLRKHVPPFYNGITWANGQSDQSACQKGVIFPYNQNSRGKKYDLLNGKNYHRFDCKVIEIGVHQPQ